MLAPKPIELPADPGAESTSDLAAGIVAHPDSPLLWALLAEQELNQQEGSEPSAFITAYAYARTGYHRSLDRLRGNGWKGWGPVPFSHEPNQGVLRAIACLLYTSDAADDMQCVDLGGRRRSCLLYTSPSPRDRTRSRMPSSA